MNDKIIITKGKGKKNDRLALNIPKGHKCGREFLFKEIDMGVSTCDEEVLPHRRMRGRITWDADSYTALFEEYGRGEKKNREVKRTDHMRCVIRRDGTYHIGVRTSMRSKHDKRDLMEELNSILVAIEKDIEKTKKADAARARKEKRNQQNKEDKE